MIIDNKIIVEILTNKTLKYYKEKDYDISNIGQKIEVDIKDLPKYSRILINVKCDNCSTEKTSVFSDYSKITNNLTEKYFCKKCKSAKIKSTVQKKYGVDNVFQLESVKDKSKSTNLENTGFEYPTQCKKIFDKTKKTNFLKYGVEYPLQNEEVKKKQQETNLIRYDTKFSFLNIDVKKKIEITNFKKYGVDHPFKNDEIKLKIQQSKVLNMLNKYNEYDIVNIDKTSYNIFCKRCNNEFIITSQDFRNRIKYKTEICTNCNPINSYANSGLEIQLQDFIKNNYDGEIVLNSKKIISPNEIDIYIPELKIAFEFNGLWWHNELYKEKNYHLNKTEECEKLNIQLIQIWEDDWTYKQDIVKSMILNKLNKNINRIYARKCEIKEIIDNKLVRQFLDHNHIQGFVGSKIKIGLFYENELVSLMTFGDRRVAMGKKLTNEGEYELLRFCNKLNINVVGGASKLFKYFIRNYNPKEITTYADRSISQGNLYNTLGFEFIGKTDPNYYYIIDGIRHHRFNFRKDLLVKQGYDSNKTEHQIMLERKIYRIYDSGNLKYTI